MVVDRPEEEKLGAQDEKNEVGGHGGADGVEGRARRRHGDIMHRAKQRKNQDDRETTFSAEREEMDDFLLEIVTVKIRSGAWSISLKWTD